MSIGEITGEILEEVSFLPVISLISGSFNTALTGELFSNVLNFVSLKTFFSKGSGAFPGAFGAFSIFEEVFSKSKVLINSRPESVSFTAFRIKSYTFSLSPNLTSIFLG